MSNIDQIDSRGAKKFERNADSLDHLLQKCIRKIDQRAATFETAVHSDTPETGKHDPFTACSGTVSMPDTTLPEFKTVMKTNARVEHNSMNTEDFGAILGEFRRILIGPSSAQLDAKLEELISILEEREADLVSREGKLNEKMREMEQELSNALAREATKHNRLVKEIGTVFSTIGSEIAGLSRPAS